MLDRLDFFRLRSLEKKDCAQRPTSEWEAKLCKKDEVARFSSRPEMAFDWHPTLNGTGFFSLYLAVKKPKRLLFEQQKINDIFMCKSIIGTYFYV